MWAEAVAREAEGVSLTLPEELWGAAKEEQDQRLPVPFIVERLTELLEGVEGRIPKGEIYKALGYDYDCDRDQDKLYRDAGRYGRDIHAALTRLGWKQTRPDNGGKRVRAYEKGTSGRWLIYLKHDSLGLRRGFVDHEETFARQVARDAQEKQGLPYPNAVEEAFGR